MSFFAQRRPSLLVYAAATVGLFAAAAVTRIADFDVWWHLATGFVIAKLHLIPRYDLFSYTAFGAPWVNPEWLFELVQWLAYEYGDLYGLLALKSLLAAGIVACLFATTTRLTGSRNAALWATVLFLFASAYRLTDRPFLLGMGLLALFLLILHLQVERGTRWIWALPLLQVLWINAHGGGLIGPQVILAFAAGESLQAWLSRSLGGPAAAPRRLREQLWLAGVLSLGACLINPWGAELFALAVQGLGMKTILAHTDEWLPLLHPALDDIIPPILYAATLAATLLSFVLNASRCRIAHLLVTALMAWLMVKGHRFGPEFLIACLPILMLNFRQGWPLRRLPRFAGHLHSWLQITAAFLISLAALMHGIPVKLDGSTYGILGIGATAFSAPARLADFLEYHGIRGRGFNEMGMGGYLIFRRWPGERVFIDGRTPVYGDEFYKRLVEIYHAKPNFDALAEQYAFDYLVFTGFDAWRLRELHRHLWEGGTWRLVFAGFDGLVYLKEGPKFHALIEKLALKTHPIVEEMKKQDPDILKPYPKGRNPI